MILGWQQREWLMLTTCVRCRRIIGEGVTHVRDEDDPPMAALCLGCYQAIMSLQPGEKLADPAVN